MRHRSVGPQRPGVRSTKRVGSLAAGLSIVIAAGTAVVVGVSSASTPLPKNLVANPGLESTLSGWVASSTASKVDRVASGFQSKWAGRLQPSAAGAPLTQVTYAGVVTRTTPGSVFALGVWVRLAPQQLVTFQARETLGSTVASSSKTVKAVKAGWYFIPLPYGTKRAGSHLDVTLTVERPTTTAPVLFDGLYVGQVKGASASTTTSSTTTTATPPIKPASVAAVPSSFPSGSSTGVPAGTVLKAVSGDYTVSTAGAVVSGLDISGSLTVTAANVTVKNTRVRCIGVSSFCVSLEGTNTVFTDGEIGGGANGATFNNSAIGVWMGGSGGTATDHQVLRTNIHHVMQGPRMDGDSTLADSYVHDMSTASGVHSESIYFSAGSNMVLRHNTLGPGNTSNVWFDAQGGPAVSAVTITGNYLFATGLGGGQQPSWGIGLKTGGAVNNTVTVTSNVFDTGPWQVAPVTQSYPWATFSGNTYTNGTTVKP